MGKYLFRSGEVSVPILFYNGTQEDLKSIELLRDSGIECNYRGPLLGKPTPYLIWGYFEYSGLKEIEEFITDYTRSREAA